MILSKDKLEKYSFVILSKKNILNDHTVSVSLFIERSFCSTRYSYNVYVICNIYTCKQ